MFQMRIDLPKTTFAVGEFTEAYGDDYSFATWDILKSHIEEARF